MFKSLPLTIRNVKATEDRLEKIYNAAKLGLRGDSLAWNAGMHPTEYRTLRELDPLVDMAEQKGRADAEFIASRALFAAAEAGDSRAALEFLRHRHDWVAKQQVQVDVVQQISITAAIEQAQQRLINAEASWGRRPGDVVDVEALEPVRRP
jgi:Cdc6-like AAA superfamily ATPase